jgi:hypothetical protein
MVSVITVSPEATVRAGGRVPSTFCQVVAVKLCMAIFDEIAERLFRSKLAERYAATPP